MKRLLPLGVLGGALLLAFLILRNPPAAERGGTPEVPRLSVETIVLAPRDVPLRIPSYGTVQPRTRSLLVAQVGGEVIAIGDGVREGKAFRRGELLMAIDPRDLEADVKIAEATLMDARQARAQELARGEQAAADWRELGGGAPPNELVLRRPQRDAAEARVISAESNLTKAKLDLERTRVLAPFDGRVLRKLVDLGQVVAPNSQLAEVYATDLVEVRLPLRNTDLAFVDLPEADGDASIALMLTSTLGTPQRWPARIVRTEGAIDVTARQLHVVAQVDRPFAPPEGGRPLKIGEYVTAEIEGRVLSQALVVPSTAVYQGTYAYVVEAGRLRRRDVTLRYQTGAIAVVGSGLRAGDAVVVTALGQVTSGTPVEVRASAGGSASGVVSGAASARASGNPPASRAGNAGGAQ